MSLLDRLRNSRGAASGQPTPITDENGYPTTGVTIHVIEDTGVFEAEDGKQIWCGGYEPVDEDGTFLREADHRTSDPRAFYCHVAGVTYRPQALADKRFARNSPIKLIAEPENSHDKSAIGIWDGTGSVQAGYVPATLSREVAPIMRSGTELVGQVIREFRLGSEHGKRLGLHIVICPAGAINYVVHDQGD